MSTARYLLCPGLVQSQNDGQFHHIGAHQLADLFGVSMAECVTLPDHRPESRSRSMDLYARVGRGELNVLHPRRDGNYTLPEQKGSA